MWILLGCGGGVGPLELLDRDGVVVVAIDPTGVLRLAGESVARLQDGVLRPGLGAPVVVIVGGRVPPGAGPDENLAVVFEPDADGLALPARDVRVDAEGSVWCRGIACGTFVPVGPPGDRHAAVLAALYAVGPDHGTQAAANLRVRGGSEAWYVTVAALPTGELTEALDHLLPVGGDAWRGATLGRWDAERIGMGGRDLLVADTVDTETCACVWADAPPLTPSPFSPDKSLSFAGPATTAWGPADLQVVLSRARSRPDCTQPETRAALAAVLARLWEVVEEDLPR